MDILTDNTRLIQKTFSENGSTHARKKSSPPVITGIGRIWVAIRVRLTILFIAMRCYGSLRLALKSVIRLYKFKTSIYGRRQIRRCAKAGGKYYFGLYIPGFPSTIFNRYVSTELNNFIPHKKPVNRLQVLQLAITNRCPLKCEHCFEWNNLNLPESLSTNDLRILMERFQDAGCSQFHLTGGEPLVKMERVIQLTREAYHSSEIYILSSGLNLTKENAARLKAAGVTGVVISLDHFDPIMHNLFRGSPKAFENAIDAALNARDAGLLTAFSICVTGSFITEQNLLTYAALAKDCGVAFIQLLEPKAVGHYENKPVLLNNDQIHLLEKFYLALNFDDRFKDYPIVLYHGYHQRRIGCMSGGFKVMYIDAAGNVDACPFCQTRNLHASAIISGKTSVKEIIINGCPAYKNHERQSD